MKTCIINAEVSSIMRELAGRSLTGTYLYLVCVKPGISTTSASKRLRCDNNEGIYIPAYNVMHQSFVTTAYDISSVFL